MACYAGVRYVALWISVRWWSQNNRRVSHPFGTRSLRLLPLLIAQLREFMWMAATPPFRCWIYLFIWEGWNLTSHAGILVTPLFSAINLSVLPTSSHNPATQCLTSIKNKNSVEPSCTVRFWGDDCIRRPVAKNNWTSWPASGELRRRKREGWCSET